MTHKRTLTLGHSPDPDDAFMFYALAKNLIDTDGWGFEHVLQDIQTLNTRALKGELDITAISIHAYPFVADQYALTTCGASMGDGYGPLVVAREALTVDDLRGKTILIPGEMTTAFLTLNLLLGKKTFEHRVVMFDEIMGKVAAGEADAGLVIHEGQLSFQELGLNRVTDLGAWWMDETDLPLPLGGNCIKKSFAREDAARITGILKESILYALDHRAEAIDYALGFARDMGGDMADRFVGMYVNDWTLDYGERGQSAINELLRRGAGIGMVPPVEKVEYIAPAARL